MTKIMFVCHGNICRSPLAEYLFRYFAERNGVSSKFIAESSGTSNEEEGNHVHYNVARRLAALSIDCRKKFARKITKEDYDNFDMIICMERYNMRNLERVVGKDVDSKVSLLMQYNGENRDVADPYYSGNFDAAWNDIYNGCSALLEHLLKKGN